MIDKELNQVLQNPSIGQIDIFQLKNLAMKFEKLNKSKIQFKKKINISISSTYTTNYLAEILPLFFANRNIKSNIYQSNYGSLAYHIHDLNNNFWKRKTDIFILIPSFRNLKFLPNINDTVNEIKENAKKDARIWIKMWNKIEKPIIQSLFDPPLFSNLGEMDGIKFGGYLHYIRLVNSLLSENVPSHVNLIDIEYLITKNKGSDWQDHRLYNLAKQPFSMETIPFFANSLSSIAAGICGLARKVIVLDLDNTIWGGVIGDDGLEGIKLGNDHPEGEAFLNFQYYLKKLSEKGIILCVCSKNDEKIAKEVFKKHKDMVLSLDNIAVFVANFYDKLSNIKKISRILNLNLDSFIFVDDSKIECKLIKDKLPEVLVINLNEDPSEFIKKIELISPFYFKNITKEDLNRSSSYKKISLPKNNVSSVEDLEKFLKNLNPEILIEQLNKNNIERSSQLIAKTNQFKFNSNLYTPKQLLKIKNKVMPIRFKDKIQNYGIISVLIYMIDSNKKILNIDNWVMSCRVFSRRIEHLLLNHLIQQSTKKGCNSISFNFEITKRNLYLRNFLQEIGLKIEKNKQKYKLKINEIKIKKKNYIKFYK